MIAFTAFMSQYLNTDALFIVLGLILFALIDFGIVKFIKARKRKTPVKTSVLTRRPTVIY